MSEVVYYLSSRYLNIQQPELSLSHHLSLRRLTVASLLRVQTFGGSDIRYSYLPTLSTHCIQQKSLGLNPSFCFYSGLYPAARALLILTTSIQVGFAVVGIYSCT